MEKTLKEKPFAERYARVIDVGIKTKDDLASAITHSITTQDKKRLKNILYRIHHADLADYINFATYEQKQTILYILKNKLPPEILLEFNIDVLLSVLSILGNKKFSALTNKLPVEDILHILEEFKEEIRKGIIAGFSSEKRKVVVKALTYPKSSAGLMMERHFVGVRATQTVKEVFTYLAGNEDLPEECDEVFVLDARGHPIGSVHISKLIREKQTAKVKSIMDKNIQIINEFLDQEEVSYIFRHYDLSSAPVVDKNKRMIGVIYIDQIVEVVEEEAEEDMMKLSGMNMADLYSAFFKTAKHRFPWLFCNLLTACLVSVAIAQFEGQISKLPIIAVIMAIVASMGGNAGTQTVTVSVRALANKDIVTSKIWQVILKEVLACALNGLLLGMAGSVIIILMYHDTKIGMMFGLAVAMNFTLAGFWGSFIPIGLNKLGLDPAVSSTVFVTFLTDLLGFFIFLSLASLVIS